jgi:hypothetical protein
MKRPISLLALFPLAFAVIHACGGQASSTGSNTNWLKLCETQQDCGEGLSCECNVCQELCTSTSDCDIAGADSRCATVPVEQQCSTANEAIRLCVKSCDVNTDCERSNLECTSGVCVPTASNDDASTGNNTGGSGNDEENNPGGAGNITVEAGADAQVEPSYVSPLQPTEAAVVPKVDGSTLSTEVLVNGEDYALAYTNAFEWSAVDFECIAEFDPAGHLVAHDAYGGGLTTLGNAMQSSAGTAGGFAWGTWLGGPTDGEAAPNNFQNWGFHYVIAKTASVVPTGTVTYVSIGGSQPTFQDGSQSADVTSAAVVVDYSLQKFGIQFELATEEGSITLSTAGGLANVAESPGAVNNKLLTLQGRNNSIVSGSVVNDGEGLVIAYLLHTHTHPEAGPTGRISMTGTLALHAP